jgi:ribosomal protein L17
VTSLFEHESITTTYAKAKEAQVAAERAITLAKNGVARKNVKSARARSIKYLYRPSEIVPKLFEELAPRYASRTGGYTRVLRLENRMGDNAPQAILELVDGKRDMKFAMTARVVARLEKQGLPLDATTALTVADLTRSPEDKERFRNEVELMKKRFYSKESSVEYKPIDRTRKSKAPIRILPNPLLKAANVNSQ